jgi:hypothetical protein
MDLKAAGEAKAPPAVFHGATEFLSMKTGEPVTRIPRRSVSRGQP